MDPKVSDPPDRTTVPLRVNALDIDPSRPVRDILMVHSRSLSRGRQPGTVQPLPGAPMRLPVTPNPRPVFQLPVRYYSQPPRRPPPESTPQPLARRSNPNPPNLPMGSVTRAQLTLRNNALPQDPNAVPPPVQVRRGRPPNPRPAIVRLAPPISIRSPAAPLNQVARAASVRRVQVQTQNAQLNAQRRQNVSSDPRQSAIPIGRVAAAPPWMGNGPSRRGQRRPPSQRVQRRTEAEEDENPQTLRALIMHHHRQQIPIDIEAFDRENQRRQEEQLSENGSPFPVQMQQLPDAPEDEEEKVDPLPSGVSDVLEAMEAHQEAQRSAEEADLAKYALALSTQSSKLSETAPMENPPESQDINVESLVESKECGETLPEDMENPEALVPQTEGSESPDADELPSELRSTETAPSEDSPTEEKNHTSPAATTVPSSEEIVETLSELVVPKDTSSLLATPRSRTSSASSSHAPQKPTETINPLQDALQPQTGQISSRYPTIQAEAKPTQQLPSQTASALEALKPLSEELSPNLEIPNKTFSSTPSEPQQSLPVISQTPTSSAIGSHPPPNSQKPNLNDNNAGNVASTSEAPVFRVPALPDRPTNSIARSNQDSSSDDILEIEMQWASVACEEERIRAEVQSNERARRAELERLNVRQPATQVPAENGLKRKRSRKTAHKEEEEKATRTKASPADEPLTEEQKQQRLEQIELERLADVERMKGVEVLRIRHEKEIEAKREEERRRVLEEEAVREAARAAALLELERQKWKKRAEENSLIDANLLPMAWDGSAEAMEMDRKRYEKRKNLREMEQKNEMKKRKKQFDEKTDFLLHRYVELKQDPKQIFADFKKLEEEAQKEEDEKLKQEYLKGSRRRKNSIPRKIEQDQQQKDISCISMEDDMIEINAPSEEVIVEEMIVEETITLDENGQAEETRLEVVDAVETETPPEMVQPETTTSREPPLLRYAEWGEKQWEAISSILQEPAVKKEVKPMNDPALKHIRNYDHAHQVPETPMKTLDKISEDFQRKYESITCTFYPQQIFYGEFELGITSEASICFILDADMPRIEMRLSKTVSEVFDLKFINKITMVPPLVPGFPPCLILGITGLEDKISQMSKRYRKYKPESFVDGRPLYQCHPDGLFFILATNPIHRDSQCSVVIDANNQLRTYLISADAGFEVLDTNVQLTYALHPRLSKLKVVFNFLLDCNFWDYVNHLRLIWVLLVDIKAEARWIAKCREDLLMVRDSNFVEYDVETGLAYNLYPPTHRFRPLQRESNGKLDCGFACREPYPLQFQLYPVMIDDEEESEECKDGDDDEEENGENIAVEEPESIELPQEMKPLTPPSLSKEEFKVPSVLQQLANLSKACNKPLKQEGDENAGAPSINGFKTPKTERTFHTSSKPMATNSNKPKTPFSINTNVNRKRNRSPTPVPSVSDEDDGFESDTENTAPPRPIRIKFDYKRYLKSTPSTPVPSTTHPVESQNISETSENTSEEIYTDPEESMLTFRRPRYKGRTTDRELTADLYEYIGPLPEPSTLGYDGSLPSTSDGPITYARPRLQRLNIYAARQLSSGHSTTGNDGVTYSTNGRRVLRVANNRSNVPAEGSGASEQASANEEPTFKRPRLDRPNENQPEPPTAAIEDSPQSPEPAPAPAPSNFIGPQRNPSYYYAEVSSTTGPQTSPSYGDDENGLPIINEAQHGQVLVFNEFVRADMSEQEEINEAIRASIEEEQRRRSRSSELEASEMELDEEARREPDDEPDENRRPDPERQSTPLPPPPQTNGPSTQNYKDFFLSCKPPTVPQTTKQLERKKRVNLLIRRLNTLEAEKRELLEERERIVTLVCRETDDEEEEKALREQHRLNLIKIKELAAQIQEVYGLLVSAAISN